MTITKIIAEELQVPENQVATTVALLDEGATVPFIARYRKEATGGLDDTQLRFLQERLIYLRELEDRRQTILASIKEQDKLTSDLEKQLLSANTKARLEDLYLPFKPKRRTKAQIAREAGLEPLADRLLENPDLNPETQAQTFLNEAQGITDTTQALEGARFILMERFAEQADLIETLREYVWQQAVLESKVIDKKEEPGVKFKDYFNYKEPLSKVPSHRALALFRGQQEDFLQVNITFPQDHNEQYCLGEIARLFSISQKQRLADMWLWQTVEWTWKIKLKTKIDLELLMRLRESAEADAIAVFKENLKNLLMAAPAGKKVTMGLDPGFRTGVKTVVVDDTGKLLAHTVIFPHQPQNAWDQSLAVLAKLALDHQVNLVSIGNGTASRETERLVKALIAKHPTLSLTPLVVSEAGASVYSASEFASKEFPDLDVSYRGAVSIARRLQDPLAELVKIDPKSIGVGQYQHDVNQYKLSQGLNIVLEDCVNAVGADVNTASVPLLKSIAGLNETVAQNIVVYREQNGRYTDRHSLKKVPRLGEKTYEQAIGFLRVIDGVNPLDASAVHPESYPIVDKILTTTKLSIKSLMGNTAAINQLNPKDFITDKMGEITIKDILAELKKPGRDPRPEFKTAIFKEGIESLKDLKPGMRLEGVITNVTNFGAFVDIGVHQEGLVHVSQLADKFVTDPSQIVKVGQIVEVKVLEIDLPRQRIQLTMKSGEKPAMTSTSSSTSSSSSNLRTGSKDRSKTSSKENSTTKKQNPVEKAPATGSFGDLLANALK
jgi:protein Tex